MIPQILLKLEVNKQKEVLRLTIKPSFKAIETLIQLGDINKHSNLYYLSKFRQFKNMQNNNNNKNIINSQKWRRLVSLKGNPVYIFVKRKINYILSRFRAILMDQNVIFSSKEF